MEANKSIQSTFYVFIYALYNIVALMYPASFISQGLLLFFILISGFYTIKCLNHIYKVPDYIKWLLRLVILFTTYGVLYYISANTYTITSEAEFIEVNKLGYLKNIYISILPIFSFYYFGIRGEISGGWIRSMSIFLIALAIFMFIHTYQSFIMNDIYGRTEMTNNQGYTFVALIPLLCFWKKKPIILIGLCVIMLIFIISSMKRGAILTGALCILYFIISIFRHSKLSGKIALIITLATVFYFTTPIISRFISNSEYFQYRIEDTVDGNSSNRDIIYSRAADHIFNEAQLHQFLFGSGADSSIAVLSNYAHNDWLEIGINHGVLGVIIYLLYFISFFKLWHNQIGEGVIRDSIGLCLIICLLTTIFSMSYNSMFISIGICIGYAASIARGYNLMKQTNH